MPRQILRSGFRGVAPTSLTRLFPSHLGLSWKRTASILRPPLGGRVVQPLLRPSATPAVRLQLSLPLLPLAAPVSNLRLASAALPPARPRANLPARIGVVSLGSVSGKCSAFAAYYALPIDWLLTFQLALVSGLQLGLRVLPTHNRRCPTARLVFQLPVLTGCRCNN
jgi:hypothetical protein